MASFRVPAPTPVPASTIAKRRSFHMPLSSHGLPKPPRALSPERPHRFSAIVLPDSPAESSPMTPRSPGPLSPPMSAKSFGTFIDSAPSTPAYSPRQMGEEWGGNSTIAILRPMSSSSAPSSPTEPAWDMMPPSKQPPPALTERATASPKIVSTIPLSSHPPIELSSPVKRTKPSAPVRATTEVPKSTKLSTHVPVPYPTGTTSKEDLLRKEAETQARRLVEEEEAAKCQDVTEKSQSQQSPKTDTAPLGKLASRMKSLLRRNTGEKKKEKKIKHFHEVDRLEDMHWSEM